MNRLQRIADAAPLALVVVLAACGGNVVTSGGPADAAPRYETLALDLTASDVAAAPAAGTNLLVAAPDSTAAMGAARPEDACHPHLFARTDMIAVRVNRHLYKFLAHVEAVIASSPTLESTGSVTWERPRGRVVARFTVSRSPTDANVYSWLLELRPAATPTAAFTTVLTGSIDRTGATRPHQGAGEVHLDLTALHSVEPLEPASGVVHATFSVSDAARKIAVDASNVTWDTRGELEGFLGYHPRSAQYVYYREPGKGGSLKIKDQMPFACPANPGVAPADVELVARWYRTSSGSVHGRSDSQMTGGQLATGTRIVGVTCSESPAERGDFGERFWLLKAEDAAGNTLPGLSFSDTRGLTPCDPALGATVPSLDDATNDFDFGAIDFSSPAPVPFPGMIGTGA